MRGVDNQRRGDLHRRAAEAELDICIVVGVVVQVGVVVLQAVRIRHPEAVPVRVGYGVVERQVGREVHEYAVQTVQGGLGVGEVVVVGMVYPEAVIRVAVGRVVCQDVVVGAGDYDYAIMRNFRLPLRPTFLLFILQKNFLSNKFNCHNVILRRCEKRSK